MNKIFINFQNKKYLNYLNISKTINTPFILHNTWISYYTNINKTKILASKDLIKSNKIKLHEKWKKIRKSIYDITLNNISENLKNEIQSMKNDVENTSNEFEIKILNKKILKMTKSFKVSKKIGINKFSERAYQKLYEEYT